MKKNSFKLLIVCVFLIVNCRKGKEPPSYVYRQKNLYEELHDMKITESKSLIVKKGDYSLPTFHKVLSVGGISLKKRFKGDRNRYLLPDRRYLEIAINIPDGCKPIPLLDSSDMIYSSDSCEQVDSMFIGTEGKGIEYLQNKHVLPSDLYCDSVNLFMKNSSFNATIESFSCGDDFIDVIQKVLYFNAIEFRGSGIRVGVDEKDGAFADLRWFILPDNTCLQLVGKFSPLHRDNKLCLIRFEIGERGKGYGCKFNTCISRGKLKLKKMNIKDYLENKPNAIIADTL